MARMALIVALCMGWNTGYAASFYLVGNSLTFDALSGWGLYDVFDDGGAPIDPPEYHIRCNSSLHSTLLHTLDACALSPDGPWPDALRSNSYDVLVLQPHQGGTTAKEIAAISYYASLNDAALVIYEAFPPQSEFEDIATYYALAPQTDFRQTQAEFGKIRDAHPNAVVVPAMQVLVEVDERAIWGLIPGITSVRALYRDDAHMNALGRYTLALTFYAALTGRHPNDTGTDLHPVYAGVTPAQALAVQAAVAEVVLGEPGNVVPVPLPLLWLLTLTVAVAATPGWLKYRRRSRPHG